MSFIWCLLLIQITWISKSVALYHEKSMVEFQPHGNLPPDAMFGYSVTYIPKYEALVVGAPKANSIGEVYTCNVNNRDCNTVPHNISAGNSRNDLWLGATVKAGSDFFVTCAPRHVEFREGKTGTYSMCFYYQNGILNKLESLSDNDKEANYLRERYMDTFGWSIDIDDKDHITIGGPAANKGRVIQYQDYSPGKAPKFISPKKTVNFNFGYSVAYCKLKSTNEILIGSPYGKIGHGAVYSSSSDTPLIENEEYLPVGSLFAASMCSANLDGSSKSALLVGAPTYASDDTNRNVYNRGAVFIYLPRIAFKKTSMELRATVYGQKDGGFFGSAIAKLGDLNGDRKDEIAISAPYEDDGRGAVYIYSGVELIKKKAKITYLQRIQPTNYRSFGLSLTALMDFDKNGCNELAIGVPDNNKAVLLRCMAEIKVTVSELRPTSEATAPGSFGFESCIHIQYPKLPKNIHAHLIIKIELLHMLAKFSSNADKLSYQIRIRPGAKPDNRCHNTTVFTPPNVSYNPTLQYHITAELLDDPRNRLDFDPSRVILSSDSTVSKDGTVWIGDCKNQQTCTPILDLKVESSLQSPYIVGSTMMETLNIFAHNNGDTAYSAIVKINIAGVLAAKWPNFCTRDSVEELTCKYQALLRNGTSWETGNIELETQNLYSNASSPETKINITVKLYDEFSINSKVQHWNKVITLISSSDNVIIKGTTKHGDIVNVTVNEATTTGAHIDHVYSIINNGITTWENAQATIYLRKEVFLSDGINVLSSDNYDCMEFTAANNTKDNENRAVCHLKIIERKNKFDVIISIELLPGELESILRKGNATVSSKLQFELNGDLKTSSITSTLVLYEVLVPIWIIILAALVGLLMLVILIFAMYELGFLRRKNKEKLKELKKDVKRQTMRQSMMIKHGPAGANDQDDLQQLIDKSEKDEATNNIKKENEIVPQTTVAEISSQPSQKCDVHKPKLQTVHENVCGEDNKTLDSIAENETDVGVKNTQAIKGVKRDPRMDLIIGGLKKNVRQQ